MSKLLEGLNSPQRKSVTHEHGPLLIVAGPGSGKTRTIVHSIAYAIEKGVLPDRILAFSFTGKACGELKHRVKELVEEEKGNLVQIYTFHGFCRRVLREDIEKLRKGYTQNFKELKPVDQKMVINETGAKVRAQINYLQHHRFPKTNDILDFITRCKLRFIPPSAAKEHAPDPEMSHAYVEIYDKYEQVLDANGWIDYANQLLLTAELFRDVHEVKTKWQEYLDLIFVDEYQDTDPVQYCIVKALAEDHQNLRVVGDDDQGIYGWRGADIQNILNFKEDYPTAKEIRLEENYRSTQRIVAASNALVKFNPDRIKKELFTGNFEGENVKHLYCKSAAEEINVIASFTIHAVQYGWNFKDFAILCRLNSQVDEFTNTFNSRGILQNESGISVMTIHKAKGLEFPNVFVAGVCKSLLPLAGNEQNEERRLLYVAMTRAQNWLCLSSYESDVKSDANGISPFLNQIPKHLLEPIQILDGTHIPLKPIKFNRTESLTTIEEPLEKSITNPPIRPEIVLGIDPGNIYDAIKPNVGWSITKKSSNGYIIVDYFTEKPIGTTDDKLKQIESKINALVTSHSPEAIAVEKVEGATDEKLRGVAGCVALVRSIANQYGIECAFYSPQQVKYTATGNRDADKEEVQEGIRKRCKFPRVQNSNDIDDHSADAVAASLCYLDSYLNSSRLQVKKRKQEHYNSGLVYLSDRQYDAASAEFKEAISIDPIYIDAHCGLGRVDIGQGNLESGENAAKAALRLSENNHPDSQKLLDAIEHYRLGYRAVDNKQFDKAITEFQGSVNLEPIFIDAHCGLSRAYLGVGNLEAAKDIIRKSLGLKDNYLPVQNLLDAITLYYIGLNFLNDQLYDKAIDEFKKAIDREPFFIEAHWRIGQSHFKRGSLDAAEQSANNILGLYTNHQLALDLLDDIKQTYYNRSSVYFKSGDWDAAVDSARNALRPDENYSPARELLETIRKSYYYRGCEHIEAGEYSQAINSLLKANDINPNDKDGWVNLGCAYYWMDYYTDAAKCYQKAIDLDPNDKTAYNNLGNAYYWIRAYDKAINPFQKARDLDPNCAKTRYYLARVYFKLSRFEDAMSEVKKALDIAPAYQSACKLLSEVKKTLDDIKSVSDHQMIRVPSDNFQIGSNGDSVGVGKQLMPNVYVEEFYIDLYLVTNAQYKKFVDANPEWQKAKAPNEFCTGNYLKHWNGNDYPDNKGNQPVTYVSWYAAMAYAQWIGKRLPTEVEWKKAALKKLIEKKYPENSLINPKDANYGLHNMLGNIWEWCLDEFQDTYRVLCDFSQVVRRNWTVPKAANSNFGFRCAETVTD